MNELSTVKQAAFWAVGVVLGLLVITYVLKAIGVETTASTAPEGLVGQVT
jgi:hypothetical protein